MSIYIILNAYNPIENGLSKRSCPTTMCEFINPRNSNTSKIKIYSTPDYPTVNEKYNQPYKIRIFGLRIKPH